MSAQEKTGTVAAFQMGPPDHPESSNCSCLPCRTVREERRRNHEANPQNCFNCNTGHRFRCHDYGCECCGAGK